MSVTIATRIFFAVLVVLVLVPLELLLHLILDLRRLLLPGALQPLPLLLPPQEVFLERNLPRVPSVLPAQALHLDQAHRSVERRSNQIPSLEASLAMLLAQMALFLVLLSLLIQLLKMKPKGQQMNPMVRRLVDCLGMPLETLRRRPCRNPKMQTWTLQRILTSQRSL